MATYEITGPDGNKYRVTAPDDASQDQVLAYAQSNYKPESPQKTPGINDRGGMLHNIAGGLMRGAGSIGATLMTPVDAAARALGVQNDYIGRTDRREAMDDALKTVGVDTDSLSFKGGKLGAEIAGTAGVGGVLAKPLQALAATKYAAGIEPLIEGGIKALQTGGFRVGPLAGTGAGTAMRVAGGAAVGGGSAGLVNPEDAGLGAAIGGALPAFVQAGGKIGGAVRNKMANESTATAAQKFAAAQQGAKAGYVVPPADLDPGVGTELLSGLSGKIKTAQVASQRNQSVTDALVRKELGLSADDVLNVDTLQAIRNKAAQAYAPVKQAGIVKADSIYTNALDDIGQAYKGANGAFPGLAKDEVGNLVNSLKVGEFDAGNAVDAIKVLREQADKAFRTGDTGLGKASKAAASAIESQIERHLANSGNADALDALREARKLIAKTYSVQKGLNSETGSVSAQALAKQLEKGKPLSGELLTVAQMAQAFPKATQMLKESPKTFSPFDFAAAAGAALSNPMYSAGIFARPLSRQYLLSPMAQKAALRAPGLLANPEEIGLLTQGAYRVAPLLATD